ncbi:MAG: GNAT family N-acetyltransferase [Acidobacteriota bacterium]
MVDPITDSVAPPSLLKSSSKQLRVARAHPENAADLAAVDALAFGDDRWSANQLQGSLATAGTHLRADLGSVLVGFALFQQVADEAELLRIAVSPSWRRQGIALRLLRDGLSALQVAGIQDCHLEVHRDNLGARALYESNGFELVGSRNGYYRDGGDALLYRHHFPH